MGKDRKRELITFKEFDNELYLTLSTQGNRVHHITLWNHDNEGEGIQIDCSWSYAEVGKERVLEEIKNLSKWCTNYIETYSEEKG